MANFKYKTRGNCNPQGKPRVYFCCHPEDFNRYFESISNEILSKQNCAIWYTDEVVAKDEDFFIDLKQMQLFVMPVTTNLLCTENDAMDIEFKFAVENHIPVLPLMQENGLEELFNKKCGDLQFLDKNNADTTAISYDDKLQKYLETVLVGDELAEKIRAAFDAYVFLSYRKKDRKYAQELMRLIHKNEFCRDIAIWYDEFLTPGENFNDSIKEAIKKSGLFVLAVTPNLINEQNYIMTTEYPMAKKEEKPILPAELVPTDREQLSKKYEDIPNPADAYNDAELSKALLDSIKIMNIKENDISPEHNFFIGLAYLGGVDVEVDRKRALELITMAAEENLPEAMAKLISMYSDGVGVERDPNEVQKWSKRLAEYYFRRIISKKGEIKSKNKICELFSHYEDEHWNETIKIFLILVDECLDAEIINELFSLLMQLNFCEYTLFFEACKGMLQHKEVAQRALLMDIMQKSINGIYPPYGPLFWYVPEYGLYEQLLMILNDIEEKSYFTKALALTRDVCWIFGQYNTSYEITNRIDGNELFSRAELYGVRRSLCELFFTETVTEECGDDVYPRCFNIAEAKHWKEQRQGVYGRMTQAFEDELGLYTHEMFSELGGEYIGIVAAPYDRERLETILSKKSCRKLCGLFFSPTGEQDCEILNINTNHLKAVYVPENTLNVSLYWKRKQGIYISEKGLFYFYDTVCLPNDLIEIGDRLFGGYSYIISIVIPDSVTEIGNHAFAYCRSLESIFIPNNVSIIGVGAFSDCCALSSVIIPNSVNIISPGAFMGCSSIDSFVIPDGVTKIEDSVFRDCSALFSIKIPNSVTEIGPRAFEGCTSLTSISIPEGVSVIGTGAFEGCSSLESITLPNAVTELGWKVFQGCASLKRICNCPTGYTIEELGVLEDCIIETYPSKESKLLLNTTDNLTAVNKGDIPNYAILRSVILNDGMISIGNNAFENFRNLISISIPNSVKEIGEYAFKGCRSLESIIIPNQVRTIAPGTFEGCSSIRSIDLPKSIMEIGSFAFQGCAALESIEILGTTTKIGACTFEYCRVLSSIVIPKDVMEIGYSAFRGCEALKSVVIPDEVISIGNSAFEDCKSLNSIIISDNITKIAYGVFRGCVSLKTVTLPCRLLEIGDSAFAGCETIDSIIIPNTVSKIGINAFGNCIALTSIILPDNLVEIGNLAFQGCYSLTSIRIPDGVTKIGKSIFLNCLSLKQIFNCPPGYDLEYLGVLNDCVITTRPLRKDEEELILQDGVIEVTGNEILNRCALRSVTIADSVIKIGQSAFLNCGALESIVIPSNVIEIEAFAFWNCATLKSIIIPNGTTRIGKHAFADCYLLAASNIPAELTKIEDGVFQNCRSLVSIKIPNSVKTIGDTAFQGCISLSSITIPASVKSIGEKAFAGCTGLKEITIPIRFEDDIENIFNGVDLFQVTINWI